MIETKFIQLPFEIILITHFQFSINISDKPFNPLINSGALLSSALLLQLVKPELDDLARKYEYVMEIFEVSKDMLYVIYSYRLMHRIYVYQSFLNIIFIDRKWQVGKPYSSTTPFI